MLTASGPGIPKGPLQNKWSTFAERLCRYVLRPPFAQERLRSDGRVALQLKMAWHDGTRKLVFEPLEFLERLAAMTPTTTSHCSW
jgi:hypothetical protein